MIMRAFISSVIVFAIFAGYSLEAVASAPAESAKLGTYDVDPDHSKITWSVNHLGFSTYKGQFSHVTGILYLEPNDITNSRLNITIDVASVGSFNPKLDAELKGLKFFDVATYPTATYKSRHIVSTGPTTATVDGILTMMGRSSPVILHVSFNRAGINPLAKAYEVGFDGQATFARSQFGITAYIPYVGDQVSLDLEGEFHLQH
jgi:polyisoprenoid-binding protein YceI